MNEVQSTQDIILDSITDGVFTVDENWRITSFNHAAEEITGVERDEAVGQHCGYVFRASICESGCALKHTMETGEPVQNQPIYIVRADGERIPVSISTALLKNNSGQVVGGVETFRDLSVEAELKRELEKKYTFADIISRNHRMRELFSLLPTISESPATVLVEGESGTGKELICRAIHDLSPRKDKPFVAVNCGAIPDSLLESELFGYVAGAFTDAVNDRKGRFAQAEGGTILLDEIGDVSPALQVRLLRLLQERVYEPLGSAKSIKTDVRILSATNRNLEELVEKGEFRKDLYYRVNVVRLTILPLRERKDDIPLLVDHFIERFNRLHGRSVRSVSDAAMAALMHHDFPGNVRELENAIEHSFVLVSGETILPQHLPSQFQSITGSVSTVGDPVSLEDIERKAILEAVTRNGGNRRAAARDLKIHPSTLHRKINRYNMKLPDVD